MKSKIQRAENQTQRKERALELKENQDYQLETPNQKQGNRGPRNSVYRSGRI
jgi:hypothetical protein